MLNGCLPFTVPQEMLKRRNLSGACSTERNTYSMCTEYVTLCIHTPQYIGIRILKGTNIMPTLGHPVSVLIEVGGHVFSIFGSMIRRSTI